MATPTTLPATFVAGNVLEASQLNDLRGAFRVLQTVSTTKTDTFTLTSTTYTDVTGLTVSITPSSATSKILVFAVVNGAGDTGVTVSSMQLMRGATAISVGDTAGSRVSNSATLVAAGSAIYSAIATYLDSPATTSATTYKIQVRSNVAGTAYVNRTANDANQADFSRSASSITVMEISA